jgi:myo-inositol-1(or 4)-monophosphatase
MRELMETCEVAARAGARELVAWRGRFKTREKGPADLVTDADLASQAAIRAVVESRFPEHAFLGEEQPSAASYGDDRYVWLVDPLDGTTNYIHGYPCYSVSVAVARGQELLAGAVYDPISEKCYVAERGGGAWCGGDRLKTSDVVSVGESLVAVSLPARVPRDSPDLADFVRVVQVCQAIRRSGSAAMNLVYLACGQIDGFWATQIKPWDVAAGVLLVKEAGGVVSGRDGNAFDLWNPHFVAAAGEALHRDLLAVLTSDES